TPTPPCTGVTHTVAPPSPMPQGEVPVEVDATASGCSLPQYQFWLLPPGGGWQIAQPYSVNNRWVWDTRLQPLGTYRISIWVRNTGSRNGYDVFDAFTYTVTRVACPGLTVTPNVPSPQPAGTSVVFSLSANGAPACPTPYFELWVLPPGGTWRLVQPYLTA